MNFTTITSSRIKKEIECPTSKSYANRALIVAALDEKEVKINQLPDAQDVKDLIHILKAINLSVEQEGSSIVIKNSFPECENINNDIVQLPGSEGGTTIRFALALLALGKNEYHLPLRGKMGERPMSELVDGLKNLGAKVIIKNNILKVKGPISFPKEMTIDCGKTTQFASALKLITFKNNFNLKLENIIASQKYLYMTDFVLSELRNKREFTIPVDFSSLGYILAYSVLKQEVIVTNVSHIDKLQADSIFLELLSQLGANVKLTSAGLHIRPFTSQPQGFVIDGSECIDLVPTLMFLASFCTDVSIIKNVKFLVHKESNRLSEMLKIMEKFSVHGQYDKDKDEVCIMPKKIEQPQKIGEIHTANDHRMVMVAALFFKMHGGGKVSPANAVVKSFPQFFQIF